MSDTERTIGQIEGKIDSLLQDMKEVKEDHAEMRRRISRLEAKLNQAIGVVAVVAFVVPLIVSNGVAFLQQPGAADTPAGLRDLLCSERGVGVDTRACDRLIQRVGAAFEVD